METSDKVIIITVLSYVVIMVIAGAIHRRSLKVSAFLHAVLELIDMHLEANKEHYKTNPAVIDIPFPGFFKITFSVKALTLENWLRKEDIELLYNYDLANTQNGK